MIYELDEQQRNILSNYLEDFKEQYDEEYSDERVYIETANEICSDFIFVEGVKEKNIPFLIYVLQEYSDEMEANVLIHILKNLPKGGSSNVKCE